MAILATRESVGIQDTVEAVSLDTQATVELPLQVIVAIQVLLQQVATLGTLD